MNVDDKKMNADDCKSALDEYHSVCSIAAEQSVKLAKLLDIKYDQKEISLLYDIHNHATIDPNILSNKDDWDKVYKSVIPKTKEEYKKVLKKYQNEFQKEIIHDNLPIYLKEFCGVANDCAKKRTLYQMKCANANPTKNNEIKSQKRHLVAIDKWNDISNECDKSLSLIKRYQTKKAKTNKKNKLNQKRKKETKQIGNGHHMSIRCTCVLCDSFV